MTKEIKIVLTKIRSNNTYLRTNKVEGTCANLPTVGDGFLMISEPLNGIGHRYIKTSVINSVNWVNEGAECIFNTENSIYHLKVIE